HGGQPPNELVWGKRLWKMGAFGLLGGGFWGMSEARCLARTASAVWPIWLSNSARLRRKSASRYWNWLFAGWLRTISSATSQARCDARSAAACFPSARWQELILV